MKERPINFRPSMVRAILDGRKTQERRIVKPQPDLSERAGFIWKGYAYGLGSDNCGTQRNFARPNCPYGQPGDRLWVREITEEDCSGSVSLSRYRADGAPVLHSGCDDPAFNGSIAHWNYPRRVRPSVHMPRWASRILLEIVSMRVERLQNINEEDAASEGAPCEIGRPERAILGTQASYRKGFIRLWESDHGEGSWIENPWVWAIEFKRINQQTEVGSL